MATATNANQQKKWIDLRDPNGAVLKVGVFKGKLILVISGVQPRSPTFFRAVSELKFTTSAKGGHLIKVCKAEDRIFASQFHAIWPKAETKLMDRAVFTLDLEGTRARLEKMREQSANDDSSGTVTQSVASVAREDLQRTVSETLNASTYLGRNHTGDRVFKSVAGRFYLTEAQEIVYESEKMSPPLFMRALTVPQIRMCASGLLKACEKGEGQTNEKLLNFLCTVLDKESSDISVADRTLVASAIDSALLEALVENNERPADAWADAAYFDEMMVGRAQFAADSTQAPYIPAPIAVQIQRFLTSASSVNIAGKIPGIGFGLLPESTQVYVTDPSTLAWGNDSFHRPQVESADLRQGLSEGGYFRVSSNTPQAEIDDFFNTLEQDAMCVMTSGVADIGARVSGKAEVLQSIKVPGWLSHTERPIYLYVMKHSNAGDQSAKDDIQSSITSWNDLKSLVDESLIVLGKEDFTSSKKATYQREENRYQRPYKAFSKIGHASTMVPKNLQSGLGFALSAIEDANGPIDEFVSSELGVGAQTLASSFSPEQIDAIGLGIHRIQKGRGFILGDETGIGKGRTIAAIAAWASKMGKPVIFITDKSNLFSDLARDLIDIGEWERFRPLITNTDGAVLDIMGDAQVIATPPSAAHMKNIMQGQPHSANIIFTTYSQINKVDSEKFKWLKTQCADALVIADEAHIAAGSDSNIANNVQSLVDTSWGVMYSSATWAKSSKNLHIYSRALPESVNISQVVASMKDGGESFGEVFSSMLAMDGAFVRREHDLSKIDFVVDVDTKHKQRNETIAGQVSEILGMMALVSGEINHALQKINAPTKKALAEAKNARDEIIGTEDRLLSEENRRRLALTQNIESTKAEISSLEQIIEATAALQPEFSSVNHLDHASARTCINAFEDPSRVGPPQSNEFADYRFARMIDNKFAYQTSLSIYQDELSSLPVRDDATIRNKKIFSSSFGTGGAIYQVMRRTLAALSVEHTAEKAITAHDQGRRPVIVFEETGESFVRELIAEEGRRIEQTIEEMHARERTGESTPQDLVTREIATMLDAGTKAVDLVREIRAPNIQDLMRNLLKRLGGVKTVDLSDAALSAQAEPESSAARDQDTHADSSSVDVVAHSQLSEIEGIDSSVIESYMNGIQAITQKINALPNLSIIVVDALRAKFESRGLSVGEISGRNYQLNPSNAENISLGLSTLVRRERKKSDVTKTVKRFNSAQDDILIINRSAATGLSVHSSPRFEDSRQRELFEMQGDENPTNRIQLFGRVNRFDQVVPPKISMMTTGLKSEMRAIMMQNKKLTNLSANVRSSRENAALIEDVPDLLNRTGDRVCQEYLLENPGIAARMDIAMSRITDSGGIAHMVTQRTALLTLKDQDKIYHDLSLAYEDALLEQSFTPGGDVAIERNWNAKTASQSHAWGPAENIDMLSAFDSPVYTRTVRYVQNYQPLNWQEARGLFIQSSEQLLRDERVRVASVESTVLNESKGIPILLRTERALNAQGKHDMWSKEVLHRIVERIDQDAFEENDSQDLFEEAVEPGVEPTYAEEPTPDTQQGEEPAAADNPSANPLKNQFSRKPRGIEAFAAKWLPVSVRTPGTLEVRRMLCLVSRSGRTAALWHIDKSGEVSQYSLNLEKAINGYDQANTQFIKQRSAQSVSVNKDWLKDKMTEVFGSKDPKIKLLSFEHAAAIGARVLDAKQIMALATTEFESIEQALAHDDHNAVKESFNRKTFLLDTISRLTPGAMLTLNDKNFVPIDEFKDLILVDASLPTSGEESLLSRWKFHFVTPGAEKPVTLSGSMLYKMAGSGPHFSQLNKRQNIFSPESNVLDFVVSRFEKMKKGPIPREKTLLVGNMFQAQEWARMSKRGVPIVYADESGQRHRAVELKYFNRYAENQTFPLRLHNRAMIKKLFESIFNDEALVGSDAPLKFHSSFKAAIDTTAFAIRDTMILSTRHRALSWFVDKDERAKIQRSLRAAVTADKKIWSERNPTLDYPVVYEAHSKQRTNGKYSPISFSLPPTQEGLNRFLEIFIKTQGLQIFVSDRTSPIFGHARRAEQAYYASLAQVAIDTQQQLQEIQARRKRNKEMFRFSESTDVVAIEDASVASAEPTADMGADIRANNEPDSQPFELIEAQTTPTQEVVSVSEPRREPIPVFVAPRRNSNADLRS